jgi:hypothetical protein
MGNRSEILAARLEQGVRDLTALARTLTDEEWKTKIPHDGRTVGVVVHHVGTMYPIEIELAQKLGAGQAVEGVTWDAVHELNANHARENAGCTKEEAIALVEKNSAAAAAAVRALSDEQLDGFAGLSLNSDGPRTCQFMLEDHAVGHAWHHLLKIRRALGAPTLQMSERAEAAAG